VSRAKLCQSKPSLERARKEKEGRTKGGDAHIHIQVQIQKTIALSPSSPLRRKLRSSLVYDRSTTLPGSAGECGLGSRCRSRCGSPWRDSHPRSRRSKRSRRRSEKSERERESRRRGSSEINHQGQRDDCRRDEGTVGQ